MPREDREELIAQFDEAGTQARTSAPLAWLRLEPEDHVFRLKLRMWPRGGGRDQLLAEAHPHGRWVQWKLRGLPPMFGEIDDG